MGYVKSGTVPGKGDYTCIKCNTVNRVYSDSQTLFVCPRCGGSDFQKLRSSGSSK